MSEHDWPGDDHQPHHDQPHHDPEPGDLGAEDLLPQQHAWEAGDDHWAEQHHDHDEPDAADTPEVAHHADETADPVAEAGARDSGPDLTETPDEVFPPSVDVGPLPEPVDGWPWIDSSSLGLTGIETRPAAGLDAHELAAYAAEELPPAADPWAALAESDDPATAALAEFYRPGGPGGDA